LGLENFERGEIVSPVGCIVGKVSGFNLAMPDARHRRPLKLLYFILSNPKALKATLVPKGKESFEQSSNSLLPIGLNRMT